MAEIGFVSISRTSKPRKYRFAEHCGGDRFPRSIAAGIAGNPISTRDTFAGINTMLIEPDVKRDILVSPESRNRHGFALEILRRAKSDPSLATTNAIIGSFGGVNCAWGY